MDYNYWLGLLGVHSVCFVSVWEYLGIFILSAYSFQSSCHSLLDDKNEIGTLTITEGAPTWRNTVEVTYRDSVDDGSYTVPYPVNFCTTDFLSWATEAA